MRWDQRKILPWLPHNDWTITWGCKQNKSFLPEISFVTVFLLGATERTQDSVQVKDVPYKQGLVLSAPSGHPSEDLSVCPGTRRSYYRNKQPLLYKIVPPELLVGPRASVVSTDHSRPGQSLLSPLQCALPFT